MIMDEGEKLHLNLQDFDGHIKNAWKLGQKNLSFSDLTLVCENQYIQAHKFIICSSSSVFKNILEGIEHQAPLIYLKGVQYKDMQNILSFIYQGEVHVNTDELSSFFEAANELKIKGLTKSINSDKEPFLQDSNNKNKSFSSLTSSDVKININKIDKKVPSIYNPFDMNNAIIEVQQLENVDYKEYSFASPGIKDSKTPPDHFISGGINDWRFLHDNIKEAGIEDQQIENNIDSEANITNNFSVASPIACDKCDKKYDNIFGLRKHQKVEHEGIRLECDKCGITFKSPDGVLDHKRSIHKGIKYPCNKCDFVGNVKRRLIRHIKVEHEGFRFECDQCGITFKSPDGILDHKRSIHMGIKYPCNICEFVGSAKRKLKYHERTIHGIENGILRKELIIKGLYSCDKCTKKYDYERALKLHIESIHMGIRYPCDKCDFIAKQKKYLEIHKRKIHEEIQ